MGFSLNWIPFTLFRGITIKVRFQILISDRESTKADVPRRRGPGP